jgi:hypothetical protein
VARDARWSRRSVLPSTRLWRYWVFFAIEVASVIVTPRKVLNFDVVLGLVLVPPLLVKIGSVAWR